MVQRSRPAPLTAPVVTKYTYSTNGQRASARPVGAVSSVGSLQQTNGYGSTTLSVSPQNIGDAFVLAVEVHDNTKSITSVSGGGATWQHLSSGVGNAHDVELWLGTITTTGSSTITVTFNASISGIHDELVAQE